MFDKLRQIYQMKKQMEATQITEDYKGIKVTVNGAMKIIKIEIANKEDGNLEDNVREAVNNAMKSVQKKMQKEMMGGGMEMPF